MFSIHNLGRMWYNKKSRAEIVLIDKKHWIWNSCTVLELDYWQKTSRAERLLKAADVDVSSFDDLRFRQFHGDGIKDFNMLVCISSSIHENIKMTLSGNEMVKVSLCSCCFSRPSLCKSEHDGLKAFHDSTVLKSQSYCYSRTKCTSRFDIT